MARPWPYRYVIGWRLYERLPRTNRLVAHLPARRGDVTVCGQTIEIQDYRRMVAMHVTVARAIGADDCKSCLRKPVAE